MNLTKAAAVSYLLENSLDFRVKLSDIELKEVLSKFHTYNEIPDNLKQIVDSIKSSIGPTDFGGDNPNNGHFDNIDFYIGNESSLVLYVVVKPMYQKNSNPIDIKSKLELIGRNFKADENTLHEEGTFITWRYWYD